MFSFLKKKKKPEVPEKEQEYNGVKVIHKLGDITKETTDCIVNAANCDLAHGGGVAYAISKAGGKEIDSESRKWVKEKGRVQIGEVAYTSKGNLKCNNYVIHTVGPIWKGGGDNEDRLLRNAIKNALICASSLQQTSISIPAVSSGIFGYPIERACKMIARATKQYLDHKEVYENTLQTIVMCNLILKTHEVLYDECLKVFEDDPDTIYEEIKVDEGPKIKQEKQGTSEILSKIESMNLEEGEVVKISDGKNNSHTEYSNAM